MRLVLDEVFGRDAFMNEIIWKRLRAQRRQAYEHSGTTHDLILLRKSTDFTWNSISMPYYEEYVEHDYTNVDPRRADDISSTT